MNFFCSNMLNQRTDGLVLLNRLLILISVKKINNIYQTEYYIWKLSNIFSGVYIGENHADSVESAKHLFIVYHLTEQNILSVQSSSLSSIFSMSISERKNPFSSIFVFSIFKMKFYSTNSKPGTLTTR
jgi:hypothetical protein